MLPLNLSASRLLDGGVGFSSASAWKVFCSGDCKTPVADLVQTGASTAFLVILSKHHGERHVSVLDIEALACMAGITGKGDYLA